MEASWPRIGSQTRCGPRFNVPPGEVGHQPANVQRILLVPERSVGLQQTSQAP
jgi:hypothetical protein